MNERSRVNFIGFSDNYAPDSDGTYDAKYSSCGCSRRLFLHRTKQQTLVCPACGTETKFITQEQADKQEKLRSKYGKKAKNKSFIVSQDRKKKDTNLADLERIAGGNITEYNEVEYSRDDFH